jgi:hypothetical protein
MQPEEGDNDTPPPETRVGKDAPGEEGDAHEDPSFYEDYTTHVDYTNHEENPKGAEDTAALMAPPRLRPALPSSRPSTETSPGHSLYEDYAKTKDKSSKGSDPIAPVREASGEGDPSPHGTEPSSSPLSARSTATDSEVSLGGDAKHGQVEDTHNTGEWCATLEKKCNRLCFDLSARNEVDRAVAALEKLRSVMKADARRRTANPTETNAEESDDSASGQEDVSEYEEA